jgi:hypothetical protein
MNDETIIRMATETVKHLRNAISVNSCPYMVPSYNAMVLAAKANHPDDYFLRGLSPLPVSGANGEDGPGNCISVAELSALFAQLAIALEAHESLS